MIILCTIRDLKIMLTKNKYKYYLDLITRIAFFKG